MANNWYLASLLIGGAAGALDEIDGSSLNDGDRAIVVIDGYVAFYLLDADSAATESAPDIISPDSNAGDKRWILKKALPHLPWEATSGDSFTIDPMVTAATKSVARGDSAVLANSSVSSILGGYQNRLIDSDYSVIAGGYQNIIYGDNRNVLSGGYGNKILEGGEYAVISGGSSNLIQGDYGVIAGGDYNAVYGRNSVILGGHYGIAYLDYQEVFGCYKFADNKTGQRSILTNYAVTMSATPAEIGNPKKLMGNRFCKFDLHLAATQYGGTAGTVGDSAFWTVTGGIKTTGGVNAQGTITLTNVPAAGETFNISGTTFTFAASDTPVATSIDISSGDLSTVLDNIEDAILTQFSYFDVNVDSYGGTIEITSKYTRASDNSLAFTESSTNMTMDGSGTFGGTTAGIDPTTAIVGTVQGAGTPDTDNYDTGAAAWSVAVTADTTNCSLKAEVTGEAGKSIRWISQINLVEVPI